jgi:hypothetical protein
MSLTKLFAALLPTADVRRENEKLRMRLVACGAVALANTPETAAEARRMHPEYGSASCKDVARAVDEQMRLRAALMDELHDHALTYRLAEKP